jgi:hypothetical protein
MEPLLITPPDQKNYDVAYGLALKLAGEQLSNLDNPEEQCRRSGSTCNLYKTSFLISVEYLNRTYQVLLPAIKINLKDSDTDVDLKDKILILHYLIRAKGTPLSNKAITYQELSEGSVYFPSFFKRAVQPLIDHFGRSPERLIELSKALGGVQTDYGDVAITIPAFSRVPVTLVLWKGDEEFPPNGNILFDSTILDYLSSEDINVLCQTITWYLVKAGQYH